jgi:phosphatidylethanolamine-binding protein (PEBP) family uncharacterized protein
VFRSRRPDTVGILAPGVDKPAHLRDRASAGAGTQDPPAGAVSLRNDYSETGYGGPYPPSGDRPHRYFFVVQAVDVDQLPLGAEASPAFASFNLAFHTLARAILTPTFQI